MMNGGGQALQSENSFRTAVDTATRAETDKDRNGHLWYVALSGLRRAELAGLKWDDIDLAAGTVVENEPKTLSSRRTLPLDERLALGAAHADSGYVAVNEAGEPYTPDTLTRTWCKVAQAAGVRPIRLHDARHSCGTALHLPGVPLAVIAKWLGHADAATTARIYADFQDAQLIEAGKSLGGVVSSSCH